MHDFFMSLNMPLMELYGEWMNASLLTEMDCLKLTVMKLCSIVLLLLTNLIM